MIFFFVIDCIPYYVYAAVQCGQLINPMNGQVTVSGTTEGSTATYTCIDGFTLSGSTSRTCSSDGTWRPEAPVCLVEGMWSQIAKKVGLKMLLFDL